MIESAAMPCDFFDPTPEQQQVVLIDAATLRKGEKLIDSFEHCNYEDAEIPFDNILDRVTGSERDGLHSESTGEMSELSA
jgi:hypothetical protein